MRLRRSIAGSKKLPPQGSIVGALFAIAALAAIVFALSPSPSHATCVKVESPKEFLGSSLGLTYEAPQIEPLLAEAIRYWEACENYRQDFPYLVPQGKGTRTVNIRWVEGSSDSSKCGTFRGQEIVLYAEALTPSGRSVPCGSLAQNLAHEIGHVLGLDHAGGGEESCRQHIMSQLHDDNAWSRAVQPQECGAVGRKWVTLAERWNNEEWGRTIASPRAADREWIARGRASTRSLRGAGGAAFSERP